MIVIIGDSFSTFRLPHSWVYRMHLNYNARIISYPAWNNLDMWKAVRREKLPKNTKVILGCAHPYIGTRASQVQRQSYEEVLGRRRETVYKVSMLSLKN